MAYFSNGAYVANIGARGFFGCAENSEGDGGACAENENRAAAGRGEKAVGDAKMLSLYIKHFNLFAQI